MLRARWQLGRAARSADLSEGLPTTAGVAWCSVAASWVASGRGPLEAGSSGERLA